MNQKVYFGQQFVPISIGEIHVGMEVQIIRSQDAIY
jgi:ribosomal protein S19